MRKTTIFAFIGVFESVILEENFKITSPFKISKDKRKKKISSRQIIMITSRAKNESIKNVEPEN